MQRYTTVLVMLIALALQPLSARAAGKTFGCAATGFISHPPANWVIIAGCANPAIAKTSDGSTTITATSEPHSYWNDARARASITADLSTIYPKRSGATVTTKVKIILEGAGALRTWTGTTLYNRPKGKRSAEIETEGFYKGRMFKFHLTVGLTLDTNTNLKRLDASTSILKDLTFLNGPVTAQEQPTQGANPSPVQPAATQTQVPAPTQLPTEVPTQAPAAQQLTVSVSVDPAQMAKGTYPTVTIHTAPGASCDIVVLYNTGYKSRSYPEHVTVADASGTIVEHGMWHEETSGQQGNVNVTCTLNGQSAMGSAAFSVGT